MNHLSVSSSTDPLPPAQTITESSHPGLLGMWRKSTSDLSEHRSQEPEEWDSEDEAAGIAARRRWLTKKENREELIVDKDWTFGCEFGNGLVGTSS